MRRATPVLLAYDGSPSSATAIAVAGRLLSRRHAVVCHVWSGPTPEAEAERAAGDGVRLAQAADFAARPLAVRERHKTWRALVEAARDCDASAIVAGAHGLSGIGRLVLGSVSTSLVHHSRIPVLIVPITATVEESDGPPLLCYDGSEPAARAIAAAGELLDRRDALVLNLWESWVAEAPALAGVSRAVAGMASELDEIADEQSSDRTTRGVELAEQAGFEPAGVSKRSAGPIWKGVLDSAGEHSCSALVLGSRGLTGISAGLGSVSHGVVHHSRRPVLVVPPDEG